MQSSTNKVQPVGAGVGIEGVGVDSDVFLDCVTAGEVKRAGSVVLPPVAVGLGGTPVLISLTKTMTCLSNAFFH